MPKSKKKKKSSQPSGESSVKYTPYGNKIIYARNVIYINGNNNNVVENAKDVNIEMKYDEKQNICKTNLGDDANFVQDKQPPEAQKSIREMLLLLHLTYEENHMNFNSEEDQEVRKQIQDIIILMQEKGLLLRSISTGSLVFNVLVEDLHALENLKESHESGDFLLELAKIFASNDVEQFCKYWSIHIDEQMYSKALSELKKIETEKNVSTIAEWNRGQVRQWLLSEVELNEEIANLLYQEEVVGKNLLYTCKEILQDIHLEVTGLRMLEYSIDDERKKMLETLELHDKLVTRDCSPENICELLLQIGIKPIHAEKFINMNMSGKRFMRYTVEHLRHDFGLPSGPLRLVQHFQQLSRNEQMNPTVDDVGEHISSKISDHANLTEEISSSVKEVIPRHGNRKTKHINLMKNKPIRRSCEFEKALEGESQFGFDDEPVVKFLSKEKHQEGRKEHHSVVPKSIMSKPKVTNSSTAKEVIPGDGHYISTKHIDLMKNRLIHESCRLYEVTKIVEGKSKFEFEPEVKYLPTEKRKGGKEFSRIPKNVLTDGESTKLVRDLLLGNQQLKERFDLINSTILVVNEPDANIAPSNKKEWFSFISKIQWKAVFDFDANSNENGICKITKEKQEVKMLFPQDIVPGMPPSKVSYSEIPAWIFCNGRTDNDEKALDRISWIENKCKDMENAVQFFSDPSVIRKGTALVIFLILSDNIDVMAEAFRKLFTDFGLGNIVFICESQETHKRWCKLVAMTCGAERLPERSIVGVPWHTLCSIIMQMQGVNVKSEFTLPTVNGKPCYLWERDISRLNDLSIVCYNECENTDMDAQHPDFVDFCNKKELQFYRGEKLDFWNFMLTDMGYNHVCPRVIKNQLKAIVEDNVGDAEAFIHLIKFYHQPGSGASTVARQVLWEFRKKYRCVILKRITDDTPSQIMEVWNYGEKQVYLPLIILSDNLGEDDLHDMAIKLKHKSKSLAGLSCIILSCKRKSSLEEVKKVEDMNMLILEHSLSEDEKDWFNQKYSQLEEKEKTDKSFHPNNLLAFMVMKEEFRKDKIKRIVERVLTDIKDQNLNEFELLQFSALLSKYERESAIPVSCCDEHMGYAFSAKTTKVSPWERRRSDASLLLMATVDIHDLGSVQGLKIVHPIVAEFIVQSQSLDKLVKQYLQSKLHTTISSSCKYLNRQTHNLLIKRTSNEASTKKQDYSNVILDIKNIDKEAAYDILVTGFDVLGDPIVAQQTARYCSREMEDYEEALKFIKKAIEMQNLNSFLWDTKGQIYKQEIQRSYYVKYVIEPGVLSITSSLNLLDLAFKGIECFQKSQTLTLDDNTGNTSGFANEVDLAFKLLDVLAHLDIFQKSKEGRQRLQQYLVDPHYLPAELGIWVQYQKKIKTIMRNVDRAMEAISTFLTVQKQFSDFSPTCNSDELSRKFTYYTEMWKTHFGSIDVIQIKWKTTENTTSELRRISARKLGAPQLRKMFELANDDDIPTLLKIRSLLYENKPYTAFDLKGILLAYLALSSVPNKQKCQFDIPSMKTIIDIAKEYDQCDRKDKTVNLLSLYAPFFLVMLLWPRHQPQDERNDELLKKSIWELRDRWNKSQQHSDAQQPDDPVYGNFQPVRRRIPKKATVHFFLGCEKGLKALVHVSKISINAHQLERREHIWESKEVHKYLLKVEGILASENTVNYKIGNDTFGIPLAFPKYGKLQSREKVMFYIGFSWNGPVAYYVQVKGLPYPSSHVIAKSDHLPWIPQTRPKTITKPFISTIDYEKDRKRLERKLIEIDGIQTKLNRGGKLEKNQLAKLEKKQDITQQLVELEENFRKQCDVGQDD